MPEDIKQAKDIIDKNGNNVKNSVISYKELKKHNTRDDVWVVIENIFYDCT